MRARRLGKHAGKPVMGAERVWLGRSSQAAAAEASFGNRLCSLELCELVGMHDRRSVRLIWCWKVPDSRLDRLRIRRLRGLSGKK